MSLVTLRDAVADTLAAELGIRFVPGKIAGPVQLHGEDAVGCVWIEEVAEDPEHVNDELVDVRVRIFRRFVEQVDPDRPIDTTALEQLADEIRVALRDFQAGLGGSWYGRVTRVGLDPDRQGIEASILARQANVFSISA